MRVNGPLESRTSGGFKALAALPRPVEKSSASSDLGKGSGDFRHARAKSVPRLQVELVCQEGTRAFDPFWDGPRLVPAFAAQLMGQVMVGGREIPASARAAYGATAPRPTLLLQG